MGEILTPDICVIGAGSGGLSVAAAASVFGVGVVLVEKGKMGGECLNYGCVPSKAMLAAAKRMHLVRKAAEFGIEASDVSVSRGAVGRHIAEVIQRIEPNDSEERFSALGVRVIREAAQFRDSRTVIAGDTTIRARRFVVATGSSPAVPPIPGLDKTGYLTNENVFSHNRKLAHLAVLGGGPVGLELAQAFNRLGTRVTVIENRSLLSAEDPEMADLVTARLREEGVELCEGVTVTRADKRGNGIRLHLEGTGAGQAFLDASAVLMAAGRVANIANLGLEAAGIRYDQAGIAVDRNLRSTNRRVYAIGDVVAGTPRFTHVSAYHAGQVVRSILFRFGGQVDHALIPRVTFTDPEIAHVGMTEAEARVRHKELRILRWPYHENDRAQTERTTEGHIKVVATPAGRILGVSIGGAAAGEMIHFWALAMDRNIKMRDLMHYVPPYPTFSEIGRRAVISFHLPLAGKAWLRLVIAFLRRLG
jgi:pyruvate/2-oxoglutarate dehydrogenase complex dihydrolipoamide dehydrogenase (E3) component